MKLLALILLCLVMASSNSLPDQAPPLWDSFRAKSKQENREFLRGLKEVGFLVQGPQELAETCRRANSGLELRLKQAGLKVHKGSFSNVPSLLVMVGFDTTDLKNWQAKLWIVEAELMEPVSIPRNGAKLRVPSWTYWFYDPFKGPDEKPMLDYEGNLMIGRSKKSEGKKKIELDTLLDAIGVEFVNDFLAANPPKGGTQRRGHPSSRSGPIGRMDFLHPNEKGEGRLGPPPQDCWLEE